MSWLMRDQLTLPLKPMGTKKFFCQTVKAEGVTSSRQR
ncbi:hypothetical protein MC7420_5423 [Coleofasciculus chthonoplastes PCC 7420]|uniref:Uncharacterized protein n=1 Tax=Coleofasciculus chthonoplastes PCC 7420 TaxID=118168 RepID=B4VQ20_9CYAN|nr:hypothetical protein MC7420_5423 [Coleofasciculus chthonoplastes PCC 7420]